MSVSSVKTVSEVRVSATVIRANGAIEELGEVSYWHRNPLRRAAFRFRRWLRSMG